MIPEISSGVLSADVSYSEEDEEETEEKGVKEVSLLNENLDPKSQKLTFYLRN